MGKLLPSLGIACSVLAMLAALVFLEPANFLLPLVVLVAAVLMFPERNPTGIFGGIAALALALVALAGLMTNIKIKAFEQGFGIPIEVGRALAVAAALSVPVAITLSRWDLVTPPWLSFAGIGAAALAVVFAFVARDLLPKTADPMTAVVGLLALASMAPMVPLLGADEDEPVPDA